MCMVEDFSMLAMERQEPDKTCRLVLTTPNVQPS